MVSFDPNDSTFSLSVQEQELYKTNSLTQSLTDVFVTIGETAYETDTPVCFFIDEIQYMKQEELGAVISALHRVNQLGYPVMVIGAGLPKIYKMLSEEKSYSERLFIYKEISSLSEEQSTKDNCRSRRNGLVSFIRKPRSGRSLILQRGIRFLFSRCVRSYIRIRSQVRSVKQMWRRNLPEFSHVPGYWIFQSSL